MSPSPASAPRRRGAPDAFGAARLLYEKAAGRSCRRRARPTFHSTTGVTALQRAPSDKGPRPTGNLPLLDRPPAAASGSSEDVACAYGIRPARPTCVGARAAPSAPEAGPVRTAWPPVSTTGAAAPKHGIPSDRRRTARPGKGRHRPQTRHTRRIIPAGRAASGRGPTLPRTVRSVTRIRHQDNRVARPRSQIPVHGFPIRAQFIDRLSTELPTGQCPS